MRATTSQPCTVAEALRRARRALEAAGVSDARREADELYAALIGGATSAAWLDGGRRMDAPLLERLEGAAAKRAAGWPQAYATGRANFRGHWLEVDPRVLIPRPETEGLVGVVLEWAQRQAHRRTGAPAHRRTDAQTHRRTGAPAHRGSATKRLTAVDVGTGSGAIAIALAVEGPFYQVWATDVSADALEVARANAGRLGVADRVVVRPGRLLEPLVGERVNVIVSNPPYIRTAELASLDPSVRDYEPVAALDGGADGLFPSRALAAAAHDHLVPGGLLALEVDERRGLDVVALVGEAGFEDVHVEDDLVHRPRYVWATTPER